jgi:ssDNA-binding Zn-finger/Zn-ribbon topoisomerase 1
MARRRSDIGGEIGSTIGGIVILFAITSAIADHFKINFVVALLILIAGWFSLVLLAKGVASVSGAIKRNKPCAHGIRRGKDGGCEDCVKEEARRQAEWRATQSDYERKQRVRKEATALRRDELRSLTAKWLGRAESYLLMTPQRFEDSIAVLFRQLGYEVKQTPYSNDRGKDAIAWKDGKKYLIECKRYAADGLIGRRDLQSFVAAMKEENAEAGFYINTGRFAKTAVEYAAQNQIDLYDADRFPVLVNTAYPVREEISTAKVMCLECGVIVSLPVGETPTSGLCENGHTVTNDIVIAQMLSTPLGFLQLLSGRPSLPDIVCARCGSKMRVVNGTRGKFWGCSQYPKCRFTKRYDRSEEGMR